MMGDGLGVTCGDHDDRNMAGARVLGDLLKDRRAIDAAKMKVEHENIRCAALDDLQRRGAIRCGHHFEAVMLQPVAIQFEEIVAVFDDEHTLTDGCVGRSTHNYPS